MSPYKKPLTHNGKPSIFYYPCQQKRNTLSQIEHFQFSRVLEDSGRKPEADRKADLPFFVLLQFRKLPEGFRKAYRKRTRELSFYAGPGRFPEGFPEADRKENNHLTPQKK